jgi:cytochrome P450
MTGWLSEGLRVADIQARLIDPGLIESVRTPRGGGGFPALLIKSRRTTYLLARLAAWVGGRKGAPINAGKALLAVRHADVVAALQRDTDFLLAPINAKRIEEVNGPFILGMDRTAARAREADALHTAMRDVDFAAVVRAATQDADDILGKMGSANFDAVNDYARLISGRTAARLFGLHVQDMPLFLEVARAIFYHIFFNGGGDKRVTARAKTAGAQLTVWLTDEIARRRASNDLGSDLMGAMLTRAAISDEAIRRTLGGMLVGSIDTISASVSKLLVTLSLDPKLYAAASASLNDPAKLTGYCMEGLRRWPQNPTLVRSAAADLNLGGTAVKAGGTIIVWTQAAMFDGSVFVDPLRSKPDRNPRHYLHFGEGIHTCTGRELSLMQIPVLIGALLERGVTVTGKMAWAGPFPDHLPLKLGRT